MNKKWLYIGGGYVVGVVMSFVVFLLIGPRTTKESNEDLHGATFFDKCGDVINEKAFQVFQVVENHAALARAEYGGFFLGATYLLYNEDGHYYYDEEIVKRPTDKQFYQVGIYKYKTRDGQNKTVPIISNFDSKPIQP